MEDTLIMMWGYLIAAFLWVVDMVLVIFFDIDTKYILSGISLVIAIMTLGYTVVSLIMIL